MRIFQNMYLHSNLPIRLCARPVGVKIRNDSITVRKEGDSFIPNVAVSNHHSSCYISQSVPAEPILLPSESLTFLTGPRVVCVNVFVSLGVWIHLNGDRGVGKFPLFLNIYLHF